MRVSAFLMFWLMARGGTLFAKYSPSFDQGLKSRSQALHSLSFYFEAVQVSEKA